MNLQIHVSPQIILSLQNVAGTGPGGRVIAKDLQNVTAAAVGAPAAVAQPVTQPGAAYTDIDLSNMRKVCRQYINPELLTQILS